MASPNLALIPVPPTTAAGTLPFLGEIVILLLATVLLAYICHRIRLVPIVGFLLAGVIIGPTSFGLVKDQVLVDWMAEVGVILLLFTIGIEFSLGKLARIRKLIVGGGTLQVGVTAGIVALGLTFLDVRIQDAVFTGFLVSLSSTALVLKLLADHDSTDTPAGRFSLAILIFQDLAVIGMVLFLPVLGGDSGTQGNALVAIGEAILLIVVVLVAARRIVPWLLERIVLTRSPELFLPAVVAICLGTAWLMSLAGISLALGAFVAGLVVSESRYCSHALSEVLPLRTIFNAAFFVSVGMLLDVGYVAEHWVLVAVATVSVLVFKFLVVGGAVLAMRFPVRIAVVVGLTLAQIGEFSFVLARTGEQIGLSPAGLGAEGMQAFVAVAVLLMILTPLLVAIGEPVGRLLQNLTSQASDTSTASPATAKLEDHVVVTGFGDSGQRLAAVLRDTGLPFCVVELDPTRTSGAEAEGTIVIPGDPTQVHILEAARIKQAKMCVVFMESEEAARRTVAAARQLNPTVQIIAHTRQLAAVESFLSIGADIVVPEELETSIRVFTHVLNAYMIPKEEIQAQVSAIRAGDYEIFRGSVQEAHLMVLQGLDDQGLHTRAVAVREGSILVGRTLEELDLRGAHRLTVLAVRRGERTMGNPSATFKVQAGDRLVIVGTSDDFVASAHLFRAH